MGQPTPPIQKKGVLPQKVFMNMELKENRTKEKALFF
jgi:hypothetical protein